MKYIIFELQKKSEIEIIPVIFPHSIVHADMADAIQSIEDMKFAKPVSAGFVNVACQCFGESETLKLKSREQDTQLIAFIDYIQFK